jgi:hypothetical protein
VNAVKKKIKRKQAHFPYANFQLLGCQWVYNMPYPRVDMNPENESHVCSSSVLLATLKTGVEIKPHRTSHTKMKTEKLKCCTQW